MSKVWEAIYWLAIVALWLVWVFFVVIVVALYFGAGHSDMTEKILWGLLSVFLIFVTTTIPLSISYNHKRARSAKKIPTFSEFKSMHQSAVDSAGRFTGCPECAGGRLWRQTIADYEIETCRQCGRWLWRL